MALRVRNISVVITSDTTHGMHTHTVVVTDFDKGTGEWHTRTAVCNGEEKAVQEVTERLLYLLRER